MVGTVLGPPVTVKFFAFEVPPLDAGLVTATTSVPVEATLEAGMAAVNCEELTNVVVVAGPAKVTIDDATKFVPLTVSVKAALPAAVVFGEMEVIVGVRFGGGGDVPFELLPAQLESPDTANNKKRAHIVREKALSFMMDLHI
jgi:hypothetical protein